MEKLQLPFFFDYSHHFSSNVPKITVLVGFTETPANRSAAKGEIERTAGDGSLSWVWMEKISLHSDAHIFLMDLAVKRWMFSAFLRCWIPCVAARQPSDTYSTEVILFFLLLCFVVLFPPLMWRLIFTLKAQHSHVTQLPGPQPCVYIATCQGWIQI